MAKAAGDESAVTTWYRFDAEFEHPGEDSRPLSPLVREHRGDLQHIVRESGERLKRGELVAFPTETVYGLGANVRSEEALARVFKVKGRPADNPLIAHIAELGEVSLLASRVPDIARPLMEAFWPGPLTLILPAAVGMSPVLTARQPTVAVRMPGSAIARAIIARAGVPIAAPSANRSGRPSPTTARHVLDDLAGRIAAVVDGGPCAVGVESTVVAIDETQRTLVLLRPGAITRADLIRACGWQVRQFAGDVEHPQSPGQKYRHYAPEGRLEIVAGGSPDSVCRAMADRIRAYTREIGGPPASGMKESAVRPSDIAVLALSSAVAHAAREWSCVVFDLSGAHTATSTAQVAASQLYAALRACDDMKTRFIIAEYPPDQPEYEAVRDRLRRAAGGRMTSVQ
ncbi:MAG: L-threonylcarbamoyladenylate synthase [Firmicutes bacterium]|nr:L-threonylcarbamoyladenylate synthase [Bacillota bacterium]